MKIVDGKFLTPREKDIIILLLSGKNKQEIADCLFLSISTVKTNVEHIYDKFGVHNKVELVIYTIKNRIVSLEDSDE